MKTRFKDIDRVTERLNSMTGIPKMYITYCIGGDAFGVARMEVTAGVRVSMAAGGDDARGLL